MLQHYILEVSLKMWADPIQKRIVALIFINSNTLGERKIPYMLIEHNKMNAALLITLSVLFKLSCLFISR